MKLLFSLLSLGTTIGGVFAGTLQQNLSHPQASEIDKLFWEIEKLIKDFSKKHPMTEKNACEIKQASSSSSDCSKRNATDSGAAESKNTLSVWTSLWVGFINNYVHCLSVTCKENFLSKISEDNKKQAIKNAYDSNKNEIKKFKEKLKQETDKIKSIYEKIKDFVLKIEFPAHYQYNVNNHNRGPYENYVEKILN